MAEQKQVSKLDETSRNEQTLIQIKESSKIKYLFLEWSQSVTYHCFPKIFKEKTNFILRLLWAVIFFSFASLTFYILVNTIISYYEYNAVTSFQMINEQPALFPTITICDANPFTTIQAQRLIMNISQSYYDTDLANISFHQYQAYVLTNLPNVVKSVVSDPKYGDENRKQLGFNLSQLLIDCSFSKIQCEFNKDFHWFYHFDFGNCFQFNSGFNMSNHVVHMKRVSFSSKSNGLSLKIGPLVNQNKYALTDSTGLKVFIHNHTDLPQLYDNSLSIESGKETNIEIKRGFVLNLPLPYSDCIDLSHGHDSKVYEVLVNKATARAGSYRQNHFYFICILQKQVENKCDCYYTALSSLQNQIPCTNSTQLKCLYTLLPNIALDLKLYSEKCLSSNECPLECDTNSFDTQLTSLEYPSLSLYDLMSNSDRIINVTQLKYGIDLSTHDLYKKYYYSLNFYYSSMKYTYISETPQMTLVGLLANLGGSLGMFLGLSVFSLLEVIEILARILCVIVLKKKF